MRTYLEQMFDEQMFADVGRGLAALYTPHFHRTGAIRHLAIVFPEPKSQNNLVYKLYF